MGRLSGEMEPKRIRKHRKDTCPFVKTVDTGFAVK